MSGSEIYDIFRISIEKKFLDLESRIEKHMNYHLLALIGAVIATWTVTFIFFKYL